MPSKPDYLSGGPRRIRSFVRREGRLTTGQAQALEDYWPRFGADLDDLRAPQQLFAQQQPLRLEIGFGDGENLLAQAVAHPEHNFIGLEVHRPGVGRLLAGAARADLANLRASADDAADIINDVLPDACLSRVDVLFPDPWHKARHNKRRLIQADFLTRLRRVMLPGGMLRMATDWAPYAEQMIDVCDQHPGWRDDVGGMIPRADVDDRIETKFERRGLRLGHTVADLRYVAV